MKAKDFSCYRLKFEQLSKRRGKKRAIIAIARMILTAIYSMLSTGEVWNPSDLFKIDMPEQLQEQQKAKAIKRAVKFLQAQGMAVAEDRGKRKSELQRDIELLRELLGRKIKYAGYQETFNGRNSFSKTDPDATFM